MKIPRRRVPRRAAGAAVLPAISQTTGAEAFPATRHPGFLDVPTARELANSPASQALIELAELPYMMARPFVAPPGVAADRAAALQAAFLAVHRDPQFLADAARLKIDVDAIGSEAVLSAMDRIADAPRSLLDRLRRLLTKP